MKIGTAVIAQCDKLKPCTSLERGTASGGTDERARTMFGRTNAGQCDNDKETRTGINGGYNNGAGSKLEGMESEKVIRGLPRQNEMRIG
jgi:hypothetical protein